MTRAYIIALPERRERALAAVPGKWPFEHTELVEAVDGRRLTVPDQWKYTGGGYGCLMSHMRVLELALSRNEQQIAVFEDDCTFCVEFAGVYREVLSAVSSDWQQLYLGGQHLQKPDPVNEWIVAARDINRTHAYMLRGWDTMRLLYCYVMSNLGAGRRAGQLDYLYGDLHRSSAIRAYAPAVWLCGQAAGDSLIHPERQGEQERWWSEW